MRRLDFRTPLRQGVQVVSRDRHLIIAAFVATLALWPAMIATGAPFESPLIGRAPGSAAIPGFGRIMKVTEVDYPCAGAWSSHQTPRLANDEVAVVYFHSDGVGVRGAACESGLLVRRAAMAVVAALILSGMFLFVRRHAHSTGRSTRQLFVSSLRYLVFAIAITAPAAFLAVFFNL